MGAQPVTVLAPYAPVGTGMLAPFQQVRSLELNTVSVLSAVPAGGATHQSDTEEASPL